MGRNKEKSEAERFGIITLHKEGHTVRAIAEKLKISKSTVHDTIRRFKESSTLKTRKRSGRPKLTSKQEDQTIKLISKRDRRLTAPEICAEFNRSHSTQISVTTTKRRLATAGLHGRVAVRKPLLRPQNKVKRLDWGREHQDWTLTDWSKVLWTDESKFEVFGQKRRVYVRRSAEEKMLPSCVVPTIKHGGGSIMVWGCFSSAGVGDLIRIDGIMNKEKYRQILEEHTLPSGLRLIGPGFTLMQDNDPKHSSKLCRGYVDQEEQKGTLKNMKWPAQSPDLNPIELLWDELDREVRRQCPTSKDKLWEILQVAWRSITLETIKKLIDRMPRLTAKVVQVRGGFFDEKEV